MIISIKPIGIIRSPYREKRETPRSTQAGASAEAVIELFEQYAEGIANIQAGDRAYILSIFICPRDTTT